MLSRADQSGIRLLTLDRPPVNAFTLEFVEQLTLAFKEVAAGLPAFGVVKVQFKRETRARIARWKEKAYPLLEALGLD